MGQSPAVAQEYDSNGERSNPIPLYPNSYNKGHYSKFSRSSNFLKTKSERDVSPV